MPTQTEYYGQFFTELDSIMSFPADTKGDIYKHAAEARRRVLAKRNSLTKDITAAWKDGFKRLKDENDKMQRDLRNAQVQAFVEIGAETAKQIAQL